MSKTIEIESVSLYKVRLPLKTSYQTGFGDIVDKSTVIVKAVDAEGVVGWGESATLSRPMYTYESEDTVLLALERHILPLIINQSLEKPEDVLSLYESVKGWNLAKAGIETAIWMIYSLKQNQSLAASLGGERQKIAVGISVGIQSTVEETLEKVRGGLEAGYKRVKLKIKPGWDLKVVKSVRREFGQIDLMVDANSSYSLKDIATLKALDQFDLMMIEQPLGDDDLVDHASLQKELKTPVCLDESIRSSEDVRKALEIGACEVINIKPGRVGGLTESVKIHDLCKKHGVGVWCGGMMETGIGKAFNIAVSSLPGFNYPADMSPSSEYYKYDLVKQPYEVEKGFVEVPSVEGVGFEVDESRIKKSSNVEISIN